MLQNPDWNIKNEQIKKKTKEGYNRKMEPKEDWVDEEELNCIKCDRFVNSINQEGFCPECEEKC